MIDIASTTAPQHHPFLPSPVRRRRRNSSKNALEAYRHHAHREKYHRNADRKPSTATPYPSESYLIAIPIVRQSASASLKSP